MNRTRQIREGKPFVFGDLIVYILLAVLIVALFCTCLGRHAGKPEGIRIEVRGEIVYQYMFGSGGSISPGWEVAVSEERGEILLVHIETEFGYNVIAIDETARMVRMQDADCSRRKDCTHMRAIGGGGEVIVCIPHALKVTTLEGEDPSRPEIG